MKVSSTSTMEPPPPMGDRAPIRIASRIRWPRNHAGFKSDAQHALKLASANALLAGAKQVNRLQPLAQRHVAQIEDGPDLHRELLAAGVALVKPDAGGFPVACRRVPWSLRNGGRPDRQAKAAPRHIRKRPLHYGNGLRKERSLPCLNPGR